MTHSGWSQHCGIENFFLKSIALELCQGRVPVVNKRDLAGSSHDRSQTEKRTLVFKNMSQYLTQQEVKQNESVWGS